MIEYVARSGPPEAMNCPAFICDVCRKQVVGKGIVTWGTTIGREGDSGPHRQTPLYVAHKGRCGRALEIWFEKHYPPADGWIDLWDDLADFVRQLTHNLTNAFADDPDGEYHPHRLEGAKTARENR
ncbi:hypothetical protein [Streptomyces sp. ME19-01-6]|uniref:hypothetical protein n=1 Tax=Streptomyces sp. ME19-01-6 TaxID=3028686 RepID=UPI0029A2A73E|nr:hypothetical protein [Streptomyces sp. ME19-01-6]MDX3229407.1 hypothetical protein [Streptomyces sp. ME19-01-6]